MATYAMAKLFDPTAIGTSIGIVYTAPTNPATTVKVSELLVANTTGGNITVNIYMVPSGGNAGPSNLIAAAVTVPGNGTLQWSMEQVLAPGDLIAVAASAAGLLVRGSGVTAQ